MPRLLGASTVNVRNYPAPTNVAGEVYGAPATLQITASVQSPTGQQRALLPDAVRNRDARAVVGYGAPNVYAAPPAAPGAIAVTPPSQLEIGGAWYSVTVWETYPAHGIMPATFEGVAVRLEPGELSPGVTV